MEKISQERLLVKWLPVIETKFKINDDKIKLYMAEYAEHHLKLETLKSSIANVDITSTLPFALSILSRINFENKNFAIADSPLHEDFEIKDYHQDIIIEKRKTILGARIIDFDSQKAFNDEQELIDKIVYFINTKFDDYNTLIAYDLATELNVTEDKMDCHFRIGFYNV